MHSELFKSTGWDDVDIFIFQYYDVELLTPIGNFSMGSKFEVATIDYEHGCLTLWNSETESYKYNLKLIIE